MTRLLAYWREIASSAAVVAAFSVGGFYVLASQSHDLTTENEKAVQRLEDWRLKEFQCRGFCAQLEKEGSLNIDFAKCVNDCLGLSERDEDG